MERRLQDLFFGIFEASQLGSLEGFDHVVFRLAQDLGYLPQFVDAGARHVDSRYYNRWKTQAEGA